MKKLSISLLASLIALGLLATSSTHALSYTVEWTTTSVAIPKNTSNWVVINWGDSTTTNLTDCTDIPLLWTTFKQCEKTYSEEGTYEIEIMNWNNEMVIHVYLNEANIISVDNFNWFDDLNTIYLQHNNISQIDNSIFQWLSNVVVYLDYNNIEKFNANIQNIKYLYLTHNQLTTIPDTIRNYNWTKNIKLSSSKSYWTNGGKYIDLSDNPINFLKMTNSPSIIRGTSYEFERFAFSANIYEEFKCWIDTDS